MQPMLDVTVVIPTYNRHARLKRTLRSLAAQSVQGFKVVVVDDGSSPPVDGAIPPGLRESLDITVMRTPANGGPARARNLAVRAATTEYIAFIDDDVDAAPSWLASLHAAITRPGKRVVFGPLLAPPTWRPTPWNLWEARTLAREYEHMQSGDYEPTWRQFFTGNAIVRREDMLEAGGFDERFTRAEDIELGLRMWRLGSTFEFEPAAIGWHFARRTLASWLGIPRQYAHFDVVLDHYYPDMNWLTVIQREAAFRSLPARLARRVTEHGPARKAVTFSGVRIAQGLQAVRLSTPAVRVLSVVYDAEYHAALREALSLPAETLGEPLKPLSNSPSTAPQRGTGTVIPTPEP